MRIDRWTVLAWLKVMYSEEQFSGYPRRQTTSELPLWLATVAAAVLQRYFGGLFDLLTGLLDLDV